MQRADMARSKGARRVVGHPIHSILQGIQLRLLSVRTQSDRPCSLHHASIPEHETLRSSHKMCLQIVAVTFICSGIEV